MFIKPSAKFTDQEIEIGVGHLRKVFQRADKNWELPDAEATQFLATGYFETEEARSRETDQPVEKANKKAAPSSTDEVQP